MDQQLQVGVITATHGIHGEVKVFPTTDDASRFKELKRAVIDSGKECIPVEIQQVRFFKKFVILKFQGWDCIEDVEHYKKCPLLIDREDAVALGENEYFVADLIGLRIFVEDEQQNSEIGILKDVLQTGANDVYVVALNNGGEKLIPAIHQCVRKVDLDEGFMLVHLLPGM